MAKPDQFSGGTNAGDGSGEKPRITFRVNKKITRKILAVKNSFIATEITVEKKEFVITANLDKKSFVPKIDRLNLLITFISIIITLISIFH